MGNPKLNLILASASPRRKELLSHLKVPFEILALNAPEESSALEPKIFCQDISELKGNSVLRKLMSERREENFLVVSADTIVALKNKIYGKPTDVNDARQILSELSGKTHSVFTAVTMALWYQGKSHHVSFVDESLVTFETISSELMENYLKTGDSLDKAGAYGIQGSSLTFISRVEGSYSTVVGFPLSRFVKEAELFLKQHIPNEGSWLSFFS